MSVKIRKKIVLGTRAYEGPVFHVRTSSVRHCPRRVCLPEVCFPFILKISISLRRRDPSPLVT